MLTLLFCAHQPIPGRPLLHTASRLLDTLAPGGLSHVAITDGRTVLSPQPSTVYRVPLEFFLARRHRIVVAATFHCAVATIPTKARPVPRLRTLARVLTGGLISSPDCVSVCRAVLHRAGLRSPRTIATPQRLLDWSRHAGADIVVMDEP